ncbi:hypothetical protein HYDPIDRAFT_30449 [Hydnomerulius pinastri MD-312]|uniref:Uncharacterized protein n=1 Tax=Hydnomerulius pinastri MD-312 TaxID=994086 RepID=A0A0C9W6F1_9AGAM|nr:hypothetical protein HYDPIDRAFT_30449 [Hydnomerulius pinastri MD-312]
MAPVSTQPIPSLMNVYNVESFGDEKRPQQCQLHYDTNSSCRCSESSSHRACHKERWRRVILPIALSLLAVGAMLVVSIVADIDLLDLIGINVDESGVSLGKRQTTSTSQSSFTKNKFSGVAKVHFKIHCAARATCAHAVEVSLAWSVSVADCVQQDLTRLSDPTWIPPSLSSWDSAYVLQNSGLLIR